MSSHTIVIESLEDKGRVLERIESVPNDDKTEDWLQELLFQRPEIIPVQKFDEAITALIPLAREVETAAGYIDDLFPPETLCVALRAGHLLVTPHARRTR